MATAFVSAYTQDVADESAKVGSEEDYKKKTGLIERDIAAIKARILQLVEKRSGLNQYLDYQISPNITSVEKRLQTLGSISGMNLEVCLAPAEAIGLKILCAFPSAGTSHAIRRHI